jgi:hypothetical protein
VTENLDGKVWEEPTLEVLGDLATITAAGGMPFVDGVGTSSVTGPP